MNIPEFVHIDLFSGIGGFAFGFQKAGLNIVEHFFSEIDKNAINIYKNRFPLASCLTGGGHSGGNHSDMDLIVQKTKRNSQGNRINAIDGNSSCLSAHGG